MSFINYSSREIILKIVYYGPGLSGKTTNIKFIYAATNPDARGKLISLETKAERTLFFDFLPLSLPAIRGFKTRLHLYTCLLYTSPSPRDRTRSRMPSSA